MPKYTMTVTIDVTQIDDSGKGAPFSHTQQTWSGLSYQSLVDVQDIQLSATQGLHDLGKKRAAAMTAAPATA